MGTHFSQHGGPEKTKNGFKIPLSRARKSHFLILGPIAVTRSDLYYII